MVVIELDASDWRRESHFYEALLPRLGAPAWHGHNLDAISDSIFAGGINKLEPPFVIRVTGIGHLSKRMKTFVRKFACLIEDGRRETGRQVFVSFVGPL